MAVDMGVNFLFFTPLWALYTPDLLSPMMVLRKMWTYGASKNPRAIFLEKKSACGNVPRSSGLPKIWGPFF